MLPTDKDLVLLSKQSLDCRAIENLGTEGANLNPKSNSELTSISNTVPSFGNDSPFSKPTGPSEFLPLPLELQPASCSSNRNETSLAGLEGDEMTLLPNIVPTAQGPLQSEFSPTGGPTEFILRGPSMGNPMRVVVPGSFPDTTEVWHGPQVGVAFAVCLRTPWPQEACCAGLSKEKQ